MPLSLDAPISPTQRRIRVLLVEDEISTVFAMREYFTSAGCDVDCAVDPSDAVHLIWRHTYDAIITDLHLTSSLNGEGMVIVSEARKRNPAACVVMLTAYDTKLTEREAIERGVDLYDVKPTQLPNLMAFIERALNGQAAPQALPRPESGRRC